MRIRLETLGCRLNIAEMERLARQFADRGHRVVGPGEPAELCVVNTCAVTLPATRKSRRLLVHLRRACPRARLVVTGCHAELAPAEVTAGGADLVVGNGEKDRLLSILESRGWLAEATGEDAGERASWPFEESGHTRAFVKVQDGCANRCAFCIVARLRGPERSREPGEVVEEIRRLLERGYREVVLTGVHLASYGRDLDFPGGLAGLVRRILASTSVRRLRLSSLEPWDLGEPFFELLAEPRLLPHLHLPLQSGSAGTLRRMRRGTTPGAFARLVARARRAAPELAVSSDVMVGFPGESDGEFEESLSFVREMGFSRLHVFRYSPRPGTAAASLPDRVAGVVSLSRSRRMHALGVLLERVFQERHLGRTMEVLFESGEPTPAGRRYHGLTGNYLRVVVDAPEGLRLRNRELPVSLRALQPGAMVASLAVGR